jgi:hypothetical protein
VVGDRGAEPEQARRVVARWVLAARVAHGYVQTGDSARVEWVGHVDRVDLARGVVVAKDCTHEGRGAGRQGRQGGRGEGTGAGSVARVVARGATCSIPTHAQGAARAGGPNSLVGGRLGTTSRSCVNRQSDSTDACEGDENGASSGSAKPTRL